MKKNFKQVVLCAALTALMCSCASQQKITYMEGIDNLPAELFSQESKAVEPTAMPGDLIQIIVSGRNVEAVKPYNKSTYIKDIAGNASSSTSERNNSIEYYLVDNDGNIEFPVIGALHIAGLDKAGIQDLVISKLYPNHLIEKPAVEVRFRNFQVTMLGEVGKNGIITSNNERFNILEAIAMAGDLTIKGKRDNVMLIRTEKDGSRSIHRINLNDKNLMRSPYFNLQQNDMVYVEPNSSKQRSAWQMPVGLTVGLSTLGSLLSIATLVITLTK